MNSKILITLFVILMSICIFIAYYYFGKKSPKQKLTLKQKLSPPTQPNPSGKSILPSGYFLDKSGNTLVSDDKSHQAKITQVTSTTYNGLELVISPPFNIPNVTNSLALSKVEILSNGNLQFYKPDGTLPLNYIKVGGLNSYMKFDKDNVLSFYTSQNLKIWDINNGDYIYPNPTGKNILTSGYCLDDSGNALVSDDGSHKAKIIVTSLPYSLVVTPASTIPNGRDILEVSIVEILRDGTLQFHKQDGTVPSDYIIGGGLNSFMKFDSSNVLSFYNSQNLKLWDINHGLSPSYPNPTGKNILTSGYCLDASGNTLVSDDTSHKAMITKDLTLAILPPSTDPKAINTLTNCSKVEISFDNNLNFYDQSGNVIQGFVQNGDIHCYLKFDSSNVLSFYNSLGQKIWDMNKGSYEVMSLYDSMSYAMTPLNAKLNDRVSNGPLVNLKEGIIIPRKPGGSISDYNSISILNNLGKSITSLTIQNVGKSTFFYFEVTSTYVRNPDADPGDSHKDLGCYLTAYKSIDYNNFGRSNYFTPNSLVKVWVTDQMNNILYSLPSWDPIAESNSGTISFPPETPLRNGFSVVLDFSDLQMILLDSNGMNEYTRIASPSGVPGDSKCTGDRPTETSCCCSDPNNGGRMDYNWNPAWKAYTEDTLTFTCNDPENLLTQCPYNVNVNLQLVQVST